ncbi:MAG: acetyl-CoA carboxylase carboxyl transferase subunit alpha, partial [Deltaproteobacteria bacterium]|nr:acetyl-CoA carboxylase carboxyl transferase subunit alpha [Deltaproteobacteria bacterium]
MAATVYLEFEKPIAELEKKIEELRSLGDSDLTTEIDALESRVETKRQE